MKIGDRMCPDCRANNGLPPFAFSQYSAAAAKTDTYPSDTKVYDLALGLCSEAGEFAGVLKKRDRDAGHSWDDASIRHAMLELGDVLWYLSELASVFGFTLEEVAKMNIEKLRSRRERGTLGGSGDDR